jgi:hypothetical protein
VRLEGLCQLKRPVTLSGIDPATFQFVAQCLNQLRYRVLPLTHYVIVLKPVVHTAPSMLEGLMLQNLNLSSPDINYVVGR